MARELFTANSVQIILGTNRHPRATFLSTEGVMYAAYLNHIAGGLELVAAFNPALHVIQGAGDFDREINGVRWLDLDTLNTVPITRMALTEEQLRSLEQV